METYRLDSMARYSCFSASKPHPLCLCTIRCSSPAAGGQCGGGYHWGSGGDRGEAPLSPRPESSDWGCSRTLRRWPCYYPRSQKQVSQRCLRQVFICLYVVFLYVCVYLLMRCIGLSVSVHAYSIWASLLFSLMHKHTHAQCAPPPPRCHSVKGCNQSPRLTALSMLLMEGQSGQTGRISPGIVLILLTSLSPLETHLINVCCLRWSALPGSL